MKLVLAVSVESETYLTYEQRAAIREIVAAALQGPLAGYFARVTDVVVAEDE